MFCLKIFTNDKGNIRQVCSVLILSEPKTSQRSLFLLSGYIYCLQTRHKKLLAVLGINVGGFSQIVISLVATMLSNGIVSEVCEKIRETGMPWATAMPPISGRYI